MMLIKILGYNYGFNDGKVETYYVNPDNITCVYSANVQKTMTGIALNSASEPKYIYINKPIDKVLQMIDNELTKASTEDER